MRHRRALKLALWASGLLLALWLLFQLVATVLDSTMVTVDLERREAAAETTLSDLNCRKELKAAFPFFTFTCQNARENR
jgi:hypothetical protein